MRRAGRSGSSCAGGGRRGRRRQASWVGLGRGGGVRAMAAKPGHFIAGRAEAEESNPQYFV